jgi:hypothetical protein
VKPRPRPDTHGPVIRAPSVELRTWPGPRVRVLARELRPVTDRSSYGPLQGGSGSA